MANNEQRTQKKKIMGVETILPSCPPRHSNDNKHLTIHYYALRRIKISLLLFHIFFLFPPQERKGESERKSE